MNELTKEHQQHCLMRLHAFKMSAYEQQVVTLLAQDTPVSVLNYKAVLAANKLASCPYCLAPVLPIDQHGCSQCYELRKNFPICGSSIFWVETEKGLELLKQQLEAIQALLQSKLKPATDPQTHACQS